MAKRKSSSSDLGISGGGAGKGDSPRNCFSQQFRDNFDAIDWHRIVNNSPGTYFERDDSLQSNSGAYFGRETKALLKKGGGQWTKAHDDALHAFCDKIEMIGLCNTSSHWPS